MGNTYNPNKGYAGDFDIKRGYNTGKDEISSQIVKIYPNGKTDLSFSDLVDFTQPDGTVIKGVDFNNVYSDTGDPKTGVKIQSTDKPLFEERFRPDGKLLRDINERKYATVSNTLSDPNSGDNAKRDMGMCIGNKCVYMGISKRSDYSVQINDVGYTKSNPEVYKKAMTLFEEYKNSPEGQAKFVEIHKNRDNKKGVELLEEVKKEIFDKAAVVQKAEDEANGTYSGKVAVASIREASVIYNDESKQFFDQASKDSIKKPAKLTPKDVQKVSNNISNGGGYKSAMADGLDKVGNHEAAKVLRNSAENGVNIAEEAAKANGVQLGSGGIDVDAVAAGAYNILRKDIAPDSSKDSENGPTPDVNDANYEPTRYMHLDKNYTGAGGVLTRHVFSPYATFGIGGMPASYLPNTDPPAWTARDHAGLGLTYLQHYVRYGQYIAFRPCLPRYNVTQKILTDISNLEFSVTNLLSQVASGGLATLEPKIWEYWTQVSRMNRVAIHLMGIQDDLIKFETGAITQGALNTDIATARGVDFNNLNVKRLGSCVGDVWSSIGVAMANLVGNKSAIDGDYDYNAPFTRELANHDTAMNHGTVAFLCDGPIEISEGLQNNTSDSAIATIIMDKLGGSGADGNSSAFKELLSKMFAATPASDGNVLAYLTGKYMIPQIWSGTTTNRSYSCKMKFSSSTGDPVDIFMNVIYPLNKILALALPEATGGLLFTPWVSQIYSSSNINIDFGLITGIQIRKNMLTLNDAGQPTEIEVTLDIADLKPFLFQEKPRWWSYTSKQSGSVSMFLASMVGVNMTTISPGQKQHIREQVARLNYQETTQNYTRDFQLMVNRSIGRGMLMARDVYYKANDIVVSTGQVITGGSEFFANGNK